MAKRVEGKAAIVVGGGQTRGETVGNGRATAIVLGREGAHVCVVDRALASAQETVDLIAAEGGRAWAFAADVTREADVERLMAAARERFGRIDILHNNVGASLALGDAVATDLTEEAFDRSLAVNLKATWLTCKHALPALRETHGSIVNIASMAALNAYPLVGYKTTKAAVLVLLQAAGLDYARLDLEHSAFSIETVADMATLARALDFPLVVRPPDGNREWITRLLDAGVWNLHIPQVESGEHAAAVVAATRYAPLG